MGEVSKKYMQECESLKTQITQQEKAYATLMDQFNKLQAEKNSLQDAVDRLCREKKELQDINDCNLGVIHTWEDTCEIRKKKIAALKEENGSLAAQYADSETMRGMLRDELENLKEELEKVKKRLEFEISEKARVDRLYDEIKIKNANICSTIADMVRKIMQE